MYQVGRTIKVTAEHPSGIPCILYDGDSVFCEFPSIPYGMQYAIETCKLLNATHEFVEKI